MFGQSDRDGLYVSFLSRRLPTIEKNLLSGTMTSAPVVRCINEALPEEVFGVIFEEHAKLERRAPVIDGQVCRQWRQTILHSPRAWAYLDIRQTRKSSPSNLHQWLDRSGSVPLHIQLMEWVPGAEEVLDPHCKRIKSITLYDGFLTFLKNRSFPILQSLTIRVGYRNPRFILRSACCAMPELRSLRLNDISVDGLPSNIFPALKVLAFYRVKYCDSIILNSCYSLTSLMLGDLSLQYTSESLEFPSLRFLSLLDIKNIKHRVNVPVLTTYHESGRTAEESFSRSLPSLIEYGNRRLDEGPFLNVTKLHQCYPNISRLSVRAPPSTVTLFLHSLSVQPTALPMLQILAVDGVYSSMTYRGADKESMRNDVSVRNMAGSVKMEICFDGRDRLPLYFATVRVYINNAQSKLTFTLRNRILPVEDVSFILGLCCFVDPMDKSIEIYCFSR